MEPCLTSLPRPALEAYVTHCNAKILSLKEVLLQKETTLSQQEITLSKQHETLLIYREVILGLRALLYGKRSEKLSPEDELFDEPGMEDEPETVSEAQDADEDISVSSHTRKRTSKGRKPLPSVIPRTEIIYDLSEDEKHCGCGHALTSIGDVRSEQLELIPAQLKVLVHIRKKYACKLCEETIKQAIFPAQPIPKSIAGPGLLSHLIVSKYKDHLPLYRLEQILQRMGVDIARRTTSSWMIKSALLMAPLVTLMQSNLLAHDLGFADETPVQVLNEPNRTATSKSYMWLFGGGSPEQFAWIYQYADTRSHSVPLDFLTGFKGYLHYDAYSGYDSLSKKAEITQVGCWAHCRRKFIEAKKISKKPGLSGWWLKHIQKLFHLEAQAKEAGLTPDEIFQMRQEKAIPILNKMRDWLTTHRPKVFPKSTLGKAMQYADNQWDKLIAYCLDGRLEMSNNRSERKIKPFTIGRKNWLFSNSVEGAEASAILYSLMETCVEHDVPVYPYFATVLTHLPRCKTEEEKRQLLPYNIDKVLLEPWLPQPAPFDSS